MGTATEVVMPLEVLWSLEDATAEVLSLLRTTTLEVTSKFDHLLGGCNGRGGEVVVIENNYGGKFKLGDNYIRRMRRRKQCCRC